MAKRRMITQDMNTDEDLNSLSIEAQLLFVRILTVSDDCGVVPANEYTLKSLVNPPDKIRGKFMMFVDEIIQSGLLLRFEFNGKPYLCFKKESFERQQAYMIKNRTKSEYLRITVDEFIVVYNQISSLPEISGNSCNFPQDSLLSNRKLKAISNKLKDKSKESVELSELLLNKIKERKEDFKAQNFDNWVNDMDLILRVDKRPPEIVRKVIEWCQKDSFWQNNILSVSKLRKQFDQLELKANGQQGNNGTQPKNGSNNGTNGLPVNGVRGKNVQEF